LQLRGCRRWPVETDFGGRTPFPGRERFHNVVELLNLAPSNDGSLVDTEKCSDLLVSALHPAELSNSVRSILASGDPFFITPFEQPEFGAPVDKLPAQPLEVRMPRSNLRFDFRNLPATIDS
jgi:hypothetical protein